MRCQGVYFYLDATPSHSYLRYRYKYPQAEYPHGRLVEENRRRGREDPPFNLLDTGVFSDNRYWDVDICYAKAGPDESIFGLPRNRGPETATLHLLPQWWFRNTWAWGDEQKERELAELRGIRSNPPRQCQPEAGAGARSRRRPARWAVRAEHPTLGHYHLYGPQSAEPLYTENEHNAQRLWGLTNATPYVKDGFHRPVVNGEAGRGSTRRGRTKFAAWQVLTVAAGQQMAVELVLSAAPLARPSPPARRCSPSACLKRTGSTANCCPRPPTRISAFAPGVGGHDLEQTVFPLRRGALAGRRSFPTARQPQRGPQPRLAASQDGRHHLHA
ncbi:MAG: hypothetical protein IPP10_16075 [Candidatus Competibacteraceae bacterium]|nr:hypothetical protein [Candidatus Competibacteraceae bacterium]